MIFEVGYAALWFTIGLIIIVFSGDGFVKSAIDIARIFQIPALYVGTFLIGFSTSVPELIVTYIAAKSGAYELAVGNVLGSYICNIGFVIGITAIVKPLKVNSETLSKAIPLLTLSIIVTALLLMIDSQFNHTDGLILLSLFFAYLILCYFHINNNPKRFTTQNQVEIKIEPQYVKTCLLFIVYLGLLLVGSEIMVHSARNIAELFQISELIIGITIVAIGTSIPELTACIVAVLNNEDDIAVGNIIGSNIFCIFCVLSVPLLMAPTNSISPEKLWVPLTMMLIVTAALWLFSAKFDKICQISRIEGLILVSISTAYLIFTVLS